MSFDTPAGTRGGRQPRAGLLLRLVNKNAANRFRRTGKMLGFNGLILTTVGARSGAERVRAWRQIAAATPRFGQYQHKTDRELPVIRLVPRPG